MISVINIGNIAAIGSGAAIGAWCRWGLGLAFNAAWPNLPLGTLLANLSGGFLMGVAIGLIGMGGLDHPSLRFFVTTGFLGGLTTFSAFTGESLNLLHKHAYLMALLHTCSHVVGALMMAGLGLFLIQYLKH